MLTKPSVHVMWFYLLPKYFPMTEVYFSNVEFLWESSETERVASLQNVGLFQNCNDVYLVPFNFILNAKSSLYAKPKLIGVL